MIALSHLGDVEAQYNAADIVLHTVGLAFAVQCFSLLFREMVRGEADLLPALPFFIIVAAADALAFALGLLEKVFRILHAAYSL